MKTLQQLIAEYGANGCLYLDAGNGSVGMSWLGIDDINEDMLATIMHPATTLSMSDLADARYLTGQDTYLPTYGSDWIEDGVGDNAHRYCLIF